MKGDLLNGLPEIGSLTRAQEVESIGSPEILVLHSMREAFYYAKRCCRGGLLDDEIYSACYDALCKAAKNFKPDKIRFFAYAKPYVRGALSTAWRGKDIVKGTKNAMELTECPVDSEDILEKYEGAEGLTSILSVPKKMKYTAPTCDPEIESIQLREEWRLVEPLIKTTLTDKEQKHHFFSCIPGNGELLQTLNMDTVEKNIRA